MTTTIYTDTKKEFRIPKKIGRLPAVIIPLSEYEDMRENLDMFNSRNLMSDINKSRNEIKNKKTISLKEIKKKLGLR